MWLLVLAGCPRAPTSTAGNGAVDDIPLAPETERPVTGPQRVVQVRSPGLCVDVPAGWSGTHTDAGRFLTLTNPDGYGFELVVGETMADAATTRPGFTLLFEDAGTYRQPSILPGAGTRSWTSEDPVGGYVRAWYGEIRGVPVEVVARYPLGGITDGDRVFGALLGGFCAP